MKTIKQVEVFLVFCEEDIPDLPSTYKELHIYVNKDQNKIGMSCLCGCGSLIILPVNNPGGWQLQIDDHQRLTLIGSILQHRCNAHYIITKNTANFV